jgi:hypothetical protein
MNVPLHSNPPIRAIALCLLALTIAASAAAPAGAPELEKLRASYKAAVARGTMSVVQSHIANLEKLRDIYTRGSNLTGAAKVQGDIDRANMAMASGEFLPPVADANVPAPELDKLRAGHEAEIERALKPYRETYERELGKLRDNYTRAANLPGATEVQEEIDALKPDGGGSSKSITSAELLATGKQPRLTGKAPKPEWYLGKTWSTDRGTTWTFAKDGKGEVKFNGKITPMTWEVTSTGVLKMRYGPTTTLMHLISRGDGITGPQEGRFDCAVHLKQ